MGKSIQDHLPEICVKLTARKCEYKNICVCIRLSGAEKYPMGEIPIAFMWLVQYNNEKMTKAHSEKADTLKQNIERQKN